MEESHALDNVYAGKTATLYGLPSQTRAMMQRCLKEFGFAVNTIDDYGESVGRLKGDLAIFAPVFEPSKLSSLQRISVAAADGLKMIFLTSSKGASSLLAGRPAWIKGPGVATLTVPLRMAALIATLDGLFNIGTNRESSSIVRARSLTPVIRQIAEVSLTHWSSCNR